jgi:hypothetical protein
VPLLDEIAAAARAAASPNRGWGAMCDLAAGVLGAARVEALRDVDLADDALDLRGVLVELRRRRRIPRGCDTLCFALVERRGGVALEVTGLRKGAPVWLPDDRVVMLEGMNAIHRAGRPARGKATRAAWDALRHGAAALAARFAAADSKKRIEVGPIGIDP